jgi:RimJ/RimL family protein N-acetyltransferase
MDFNLRPWKITDIDSLVENANNPEISKFMTDEFPHPFTAENAKKFIEYAMSQYPIHFFAIEVNELAVGGIGAHQQTDIMKKNAELGYWLGQNYWGRGIVQKAINEIVVYAFRTFDITRIYARPYGTNLKSQYVLKKAGFVLEAHIEKNIFKNNEFVDELIYAIRRQ